MNTYSHLIQNQQKSISKVLSDTEGKVVFDKGNPSENTNSNNSVRSIASCEINPNLSQLSSTSSTSSMTSDTNMSSLFSSPGFRPCELLSSLFVRRPSVNISHFNLLLGNHWANCNQTLVEWSLDGPLPKLCLVIPTSNQDGHQAKNRKKGG